MKTAFPYKHTKFPSGLRLVVAPMKSTKTATVLVLVGTGSKYETKEINGISHFLEHMMFKGTDKRPGKLDIARQLDSIGANYNAFTSKEHTGYHAKASVEKLDLVTDVIFDIFLNSRLEQEAINIERGVIVEEINMDRDNTRRYVWERFERLLYGDQPAGWDIAGEKEIVTSLKREQFVNYFNTHYIAKNTVIAVAGNVEEDYIIERVASYFSDIRDSDPFSKLPVIESQTSPALDVFNKETDQTHFVLGFRSVNHYDERKYAATLLGAVLGGGMSSRLFDEIREKRGLAYYVGAGNQEYTDTGMFVINAGVNNDKAHESVKVILDEVRKLIREGVSEEEIQRAKDMIEGNMVLGLEDSQSVAINYAEQVLFDDKVLTPEEELAKIKKVKLSEVNLIAKEIFRNEKMNLALIGPFKDPKYFEELMKI